MNRCGQPANPRVRFIDLNNDKQADALLVDAGPCYGADRQWFSIATRTNGAWHQVIGVTGTAKGLQSTTLGWQDILWTSGGVKHALHFDGTRYVDESGTPATGGTTVAAAAPTAPAHGGAYPTDGWPAGIKATALSPSQFAGIMEAAGIERAGREWHACEDADPVTAKDVELKDLNGDSRPEAIVSESGIVCFGNAGSGFVILRPVPGGWQQITDGAMTGFPDWKTTRGAGGYLDFVLAGPGFCFPVERFNGRVYNLAGHEYEGKPCRPM